MIKDRFLSLLLSALLFAGAPYGISQEVVFGDDVVRTIMVYMVGSDLESIYGLATKDIQEMVDSGINLERVNVVVAAGGTTNWPSLGLQQGQMSVFRLRNGAGRFEPLDAVSQRNMGDAGTLSYFLRLATSACPAQRYDLILWDHGGGPLSGYGYDSSSKDSLKLSEIASALANAGFGTDRKLEMIGFDACLMGSVEVAAMMSPYAEYMVASEEVIPGKGWDYGFLGHQSIYKKETEVILQNICTDYDQSVRHSAHVDYTLSALRLSRIPEVWQAMDALFYSGAEFSVPGDLSAVAARVNSSCAFSRFASNGDYDLFDLRDFAQQTHAILPRTSEALRQAVDSCVVCSVSNMQGAGGISFYFPLLAPQRVSAYLNDVCDSLARMGMGRGYAAFLRACFSGQTGAGHSLALPTVQGTVTPGAPTYAVQLPPDLHARFAYGYYYILTRYHDEPDAYRMLERCYDVNLDSDGILMVSRELKLHCLRCDRSLPWAEMTLYGCDSRNGVIRYQILLNLSRMPFDRPQDWKNGEMRLQMEVTSSNPNGEFLRLVPQAEDGMAPRELMDIEVGDMISFVWPVYRASYDSAGNLLPYEKWIKYNPNGTQGSEGTVTAPGLETAYLPGDPNKDYFIQLVMADVAGNTYASDLIPMR